MSLSAVPVRVLSAAGVAAGAALLARPEAVLTRLAPEYPRERRWVVRLLGARLVAQHAAVLTSPRPAVLRGAAGIDLLHAATMLPLLGSPRYGRAARASGALALAYGVWGARRGR